MSLMSKTALGFVLALSLGSASWAGEAAEVTAPYLLTDQVTTTVGAAVPRAPAAGASSAQQAVQSSGYVTSSGAASASPYTSSYSSSYSASSSSAASSSEGSYVRHAYAAEPPLPLATVPSATPMPGPAPAGTTCSAGAPIPGVPCHGEWVVIHDPPPRLPPPVIEHTYSHTETVSPPVHHQVHHQEISLPGSFFAGGIRYGAGYESTTQYSYGGGGVVFVGGGGRVFSGVTQYTRITTPPPRRPHPPKGGGHGCGCH